MSVHIRAITPLTEREQRGWVISEKTICRPYEEDVTMYTVTRTTPWWDYFTPMCAIGMLRKAADARTVYDVEQWCDCIKGIDAVYFKREIMLFVSKEDAHKFIDLYEANNMRLVTLR